MKVGVDGKVAVGTDALRLLRREVEIGRVHHQSGLSTGRRVDDDGLVRRRSRTGWRLRAYSSSEREVVLHVLSGTGSGSVIYSAGEREVGDMKLSETPRVIDLAA